MDEELVRRLLKEPPPPRHQCQRPKMSSNARAARGFFIAGLVAGPWFWLIGGWLLGSDGSIVKKRAIRRPRHGFGDLEKQQSDDSISQEMKDTTVRVLPSRSGTLDSVKHPESKQDGVRADSPTLGANTNTHVHLPTIRVEHDQEERALADMELGIISPSRSWMNLAFFTAPTTATWLDLSLKSFSRLTPPKSGNGTGGSGGERSQLSFSLINSFPRPPSGVRLERRECEHPVEESEGREKGRSFLWFLLPSTTHPTATDLESRNLRVAIESPPGIVIPLLSDDPAPWVWRCRIAAMISMIVVVLLVVLAVVWAVVGPR